MKDRPDEPGIWTREGKFYRVWYSEKRGFIGDEVKPDGHLGNEVFDGNWPTGDWHKLTAPATGEARERFATVELPLPEWEPYQDNETITWNYTGNSASLYCRYWISLRSFKCYQTTHDGHSWCISSAVTVGSLDEAKLICWEHFLSELGAAEIFAGVEREAAEPPEGFTECDTCRAKPGMPYLCSGCLKNRYLISELRKEVEVRAACRDEITTLKATVARLEGEVEKYKARLDPSICRLQFPDGSVPGDIQECAEGWKEAYDAKLASYRIAVKQIEDLETQVHQIAGLKGIIARQDEEITSLRLANIAEREQIDWPRLREWAKDPRKKPPTLAFTAGPEREIADLICMVEVASDPNQITTLKATVEKLKEQVATEHAKYINSERAATVALQAQTILKQAEEIAEQKATVEKLEGEVKSLHLHQWDHAVITLAKEQGWSAEDGPVAAWLREKITQQPEVIEGKGQAWETSANGWLRETPKGDVDLVRYSDAFHTGFRYIRCPTFPPRKPAFVAPPKPELTRIRIPNIGDRWAVPMPQASGAPGWQVMYEQQNDPHWRRADMVTVIDPTTGEPIKEQA